MIPKKTSLKNVFLVLALAIIAQMPALAQVAPIVPSQKLLQQEFGAHDLEAFATPPKVFYPETWFHFIGGNVSKEGITKDLEAIARSGISGIQLFHGQFGGPWPGVSPQITCLSPMWEDAIQHTARECRRLGLRFTMQNCPGWAMAGGPWITPANAMRQLAWSRTDITGGKAIAHLQLKQPQPSTEAWRDYKEVAVLAFPTPMDDTGEALTPQSVIGNGNIAWQDCFIKQSKDPVRFAPAKPGQPYWAEVSFTKPTTVRTIELPFVSTIGYIWSYEPGVKIKAETITAEGKTVEILNTNIPASNFQDHQLLTLACREVKGAKKIKIWLENKHDMEISFIRFFSAARKNNWESEAAWTLRNIDRSGTDYGQPKQTGIEPAKVRDITKYMDAKGKLNWQAPAGKWTILRIGHVNTGKQNGPAPAEGTGWESNKLSETGANAHFAGYIGKLSSPNGALGGGLLNGMLMDSWECETQTWTDNMEADFNRISAYPLRKWMPALFGYVLKDQETTFRFLHDWRYTINNLFTNKFYGRMATLAKQNNLAISYETAAGDVFPADILEYYKFADVPMAEFWQPFTNGFVGSSNFKPIKPAASAARLYGKPRLGSEAFTSFELTWDEHWQDLKEVADVNMADGVTHLIYHTYTHNPRADSLVPGTSFGSKIGTPFLRGQTWWNDMPQLNTYFARCSYLLERGKPVSDVLWYLGDEIDHKPDQNAPFPQGYKYDYCNPDVLLNRLSVQNGVLVTPEGIEYRLLWLPETTHMLPQTLEKLTALIRAGATVVGNRPHWLATLSGGKAAQLRFDKAVKELWGGIQKGEAKRIGYGKLISGMSLSDALNLLDIAPDVSGGDALWVHRKVQGADWYFITAPKGQPYNGALSFRNTGNTEIWDPVNGRITPASDRGRDGRAKVYLELPIGGSCFVVFRHDTVNENILEPPPTEILGQLQLNTPWTVSFPEGWGAPKTLKIDTLKAWKDLDMPAEAKAFSGTATYTTTFNTDQFPFANSFSIDLGKVDMIGKVSINGKYIGTLWCPPYQLDISDAVLKGNNTLQVEVTSTWFNRLAYDASLPEEKRKTWTISGPEKGSPLRNSGLVGPVLVMALKK